MFHSVASPGKRTWLLLLFVVWAGLLLSAYLFASNEQISLWARMGSSLTLAVAGWSWYVFLRDKYTATFRLLVAVGITLGFLGDLFMAGLVPIAEPMLGGIAAFGCGHLAYIAAFVHFSNRYGLTAPVPRRGGLAAWLLVGLVGWLAIVSPSSEPAGLRWAALPYTLLLASTAGCATGLALQAPPFRWLAWGAGLFLLSDLILAAEHFLESHPSWIGAFVWLTYGPGQMLIVYGGNGALAAVKKTPARNRPGDLATES